MQKEFVFKHGADIVEDERNWKHSDLVTASPLPIKGTAKLGEYIPTDITDQNKVGICTAITITQQAKKKYGKKYSSTFQYLMQKKYYDTNWIEGSSGQSALFVANKFGFLPYELLPDLQDVNESISYQEYIAVLQGYTDDQINNWKAQCENKIGGYASINVNDYNALCQGIIDSDTGLYTTVTVTEDWWKNKQKQGDWSFNGLAPLSKSLPIAGGHAITVSSFDSSEYQGISWANTWSAQWGWHNNYQYDGGVIPSNYLTVKPNQAWIIYWDNAPTPAQTQFMFNKNLSYGMANGDVKQLQIRLGMPVEYQTGYFGNQTLAEVKKYQANHFIPATGFVGVLTRASLNKKINAGVNPVSNMKIISFVSALLKSKTFWTVVVMAGLAISGVLKDNSTLAESVYGFLTLLAGYFHLNPSQSTIGYIERG